MKKFYIALASLSFSLFSFSQVEIEPFAPTVPGTYIGDFDNITSGLPIPGNAGWTEEGNMTYDWTCDNGATINFGGNPQYAYSSVPSGTSLTLVSPEMDFGVNTNSPTLDFSYRIDDGTAAGFPGLNGIGQLEVLYKESNAGAWTVIGTYNTANNAWSSVSLSLAGASSYNTFYIGFRASTAIDGSILPEGIVLIDDIVVTGQPGCSNTTNTLTETACDSYTVPSGDETYSASQMNIKDTIPNLAGCDSLLTINLTMGFSNTGTDMQNACDSLVWIDGNTYYSDNNSATFTLMNQDGCDSVVTLDLTVTTIDVNVTANDPVLTADQGGAAYVWLNCADSTPVLGANNQAFTPTMNGDYAVEITLNGCKDTSVCNTVATVSLDENEIEKVNLYPNPTNGKITFDFGSMNEASLKIFTSEGKLIEALNQNGQKVLHLNFDHPQGVYLVEIQNGMDIRRMKLIKN